MGGLKIGDCYVIAASQNCDTAAQLFLCNKYIVFTMGGIVALQLAIPTFL